MQQGLVRESVIRKARNINLTAYFKPWRASLQQENLNLLKNIQAKKVSQCVEGKDLLRGDRGRVYADRVKLVNKDLFAWNKS